MHDLYTLIGLAILFGGGPLFYQVGLGFRRMVEARTERLADEQEHRQRIEREKLRQANRLATAEKLHEVMAIAIADRSMAGAIHEEIERIHPKVRVAEDDEEATQDGMRAPKSRRRRR